MIEQWTVNLDRAGHANTPMCVRLYVKEGTAPLPVVLFSHDSSLHPEHYDRILIPWARAGYMVIAPTYLDHNIQDCDPKLQWLSRLDDSMQALSFLENADRADLSKIVAAGHGSGAFIAHALAGAISYDMEGEVVQARDPRVQAIISLCPMAEQTGFIDASSWADITIPIFTHTTGDTSLVNSYENSPDSLASHRNASSSCKDLIILDGVEQALMNDSDTMSASDNEGMSAIDSLNRYVVDFLNKSVQSYKRRNG